MRIRDAVQADLCGLPGVVEVHDLHVWTLTSEMDAASAHLVTTIGTDAHAVLDQARHCLADTYGVIAYQEQVMRILNQLGGIDLSNGYADLTWREADGTAFRELYDQI